ncbi:MAG TPA: RNA polymerase sigma factor [Flammeovirgaceae bacterium]|nr:RNA polymerase sigma factor [Flammeovirgaceae bacterium]
MYEHALIERCCEGDRSAYAEFYHRYAGDMLAMAMRYMKNRQAAEDVLQEVFVKAFKKLGSFNRQASIKTWLTRIVINTALSALRKEHQRYNWSLSEARDIADSKLPLQAFHYTELIGFIQQLPTGCRTVFNLYALEGYGHREIAEMLGISEGTSKSQYFRAKKLLQEMINNELRRTKKKVL